MLPIQKTLKPRRVYVPEDLWKELKYHCVEQQISMSAWVRREIKRLKSPVIVAVLFMVGFGFFWVMSHQKEILMAIFGE